jgi:hypothetical protein
MASSPSKSPKQGRSPSHSKERKEKPKASDRRRSSSSGSSSSRSKKSRSNRKNSPSNRSKDGNRGYNSYQRREPEKVPAGTKLFVTNIESKVFKIIFSSLKTSLKES